MSPLQPTSTLAALEITVYLTPGFLTRILQYTWSLKVFKWTVDAECVASDGVWAMLHDHTSNTLKRFEFKDWLLLVHPHSEIRLYCRANWGILHFGELLPRIEQSDYESDETLRKFIFEDFVGATLPELRTFLIEVIDSW